MGDLLLTNLKKTKEFADGRDAFFEIINAASDPSSEAEKTDKFRRFLESRHEFVVTDKVGIDSKHYWEVSAAGNVDVETSDGFRDTERKMLADGIREKILAIQLDYQWVTSSPLQRLVAHIQYTPYLLAIWQKTPNRMTVENGDVLKFARNFIPLHKNGALYHMLTLR